MTKENQMTTTVTVNRAELAAAVGYAAKACDRRALPVLLGVHLEAGPDHLTVTGTDTTTWLRQSIDTTDSVVGRHASCVVPAKLLAKFLKAKQPTATLVFPRDTEGELGVGLGGITFTIVALPESEWPREPTFDTAKPVTVDARALDLLQRVSVAASGDDMRPVLTTLLVEPDVVVATDSYRLAWADVALGLPRCLIPKRVVSYLEPEAELEVVDGIVRWWNMSGRDGWAATIHEDVQYPAWRALLGEETGGASKFAPAPDPERIGRMQLGPELLPALAELSKAARDLSTPVQLSPNGSAVRAEVIAQHTAGGHTDLPARFRRRRRLPGTIAFNPGFLSEIAKAVGMPVSLDLVDALRPARITGATKGLQFLLMPVRVA